MSTFSPVMDSSVHIQYTAPTCLKCQSQVDCWICLSCCQTYCSNPSEEFTHINHHCSSVVGHYISFSVVDGTCWCDLCNTFVESGDFEDFYVRFKECSVCKPVEDPEEIGARYAEVVVDEQSQHGGKFSITEEEDEDFGDKNSLLHDRAASAKCYQILLSFLIIILMAVLATVLITNRTKIFKKSHSDNKSTGSNAKPNFIFIVADDLGWNSIGHNNYDGNLYTPFLDSLAHQGVVLTNYYSQELCTPTRASLLTGRLPIHIGIQYGVIIRGKEDGLDPSQTLLPAVLNEYGNYKSYLVGKWHLGVFLQSLLPTARGFAEWIGYSSGMEYYWSKTPYQQGQYRDMLISDTNCYNVYNNSDYDTYSTFLYRDKAVNAILYHDYESQPMFLMFASQAVHDPYCDNDEYSDGIPMDYLGETMYNQIKDDVAGESFQQYTMSLLLLDQAVNVMYNALVEIGQLDNTYLIFVSDNGGCTAAGGRNGPLRGGKGTLFEGGTKVDAFIYSPLLASATVNRTYDGLFHVSDWFPTVLSLAGLDYTPIETQQVDGIDQSKALQLAGTETSGKPATTREYLLYNLYYNVEGKNYDIYVNGSFAIRNSQFKLIHSYSGPEIDWYPETVAHDDDAITIVRDCFPMSSDYPFAYYLFDILNDPYETVNLFEDAAYSSVKSELYDALDEYIQSSVLQLATRTPTVDPYTYFEANGYFYQPWEFPTSQSSSKVPVVCTPTTIFSV